MVLNQLSILRAAFCFAVSSVFLLTGCGVGGPEIRPANTEARPSPTTSEREVSGAFSVAGTAENGSSPYAGVLNIGNQGEVYSLRWMLDKGTRVGAGVQIGNSMAATFARPAGGEGCGVAFYKIASDGSMEGRILRWGEDNFASEKAAKVEGSTFAGKYDIKGTTAGGSSYSGVLTISKDGAGYDLEWKIDNKALVAFGTWRGNVAAAGFGGPQCGFVLYSITGGGSLEGTWGSQKAVTFGTETAKRQ